jgi:hypothetical protein
MRIASRMLALATAFVSMLTPALASPAGLWELETEDTRFELYMCGDGDRQLCGRLVWLSDDDYNDQYLPYLNRTMADYMRSDGDGRWEGRIELLGYRLQGTITQRSEDHLTLSGCAFLVVCRTYEMYRME